MIGCCHCGSHVEAGEHCTENWLRFDEYPGLPPSFTEIIFVLCVCCLESRTREVAVPWKENYDRLTKQLQAVTYHPF